MVLLELRRDSRVMTGNLGFLLLALKSNLPFGLRGGAGGFPDRSVGKDSTCNAGHPGSIPGSGRSTGEGIGYRLQDSGLENSMDCIVHGITKSRTRLSDFHFSRKSYPLHERSW